MGSLSRFRKRSRVGERLVLLVVSQGVTGNAAKPIGAACWYRMNAAGSRRAYGPSLFSLSPSSLDLSLTLSFSHSLCCLCTPILLLYLSKLSLPLSFFVSLSLSYLWLFLWRGNPSDGRAPCTKAAGCCFSPLLLFCLSVRLSPFSARAFFFSLSLSLFLVPFLLAARWLVHWFHRCIGPGSSYSFL